MSLPPSVNAGFSRAAEHLQVLTREVERSLAELWRSGVVRNEDERNGDYVWFMRAPPGDAARISVIAGDVVRTLRSVVNRLVYEAASDDAPAPVFKFPVSHRDGDGDADFDTLPPDVRAVVEALHALPAAAEALRRLDELARADRLRGLVVAPVGSRRPAMGVPLLHPGSLPLSLGVSMRSGKFRDGDEVLRVSRHNPAAVVDVIRPALSYEITLDEPRASGPIVPQLTRLCDFVRSDVVPAFAPLF